MDIGPFGFTEILFIGLLALVVFGPRRLPEIGHAVGRAVAQLKRATHELRAAYESEIDEESRREIDAARQTLREVKGTIEAAGREVWSQGGEVAKQLEAAKPRGDAVSPAGVPDGSTATAADSERTS